MDENIKTLANTSVDYLRGFFPDADKIQLEEVEITDDNKYWSITLSYESNDNPEQNSGWLLSKSRKFKIFKVDAQKGNVRSMKIRDMR